MAIFGVHSPKFKVSATDVLLDNTVINEIRQDHSDIVHESEIDRARVIVTKPVHLTIQMTVHLYKYSDPIAKYDAIATHEKATCQIWKHRDFQAYQDDAGADADFILTEVEPFYLTQWSYVDAVRLTFVSVDAINVADYGDNFTFARALSSGASNAWYTDPDGGLLIEAADTTTSRRLVAGKFEGTGLLLEGARTNLITHPNDITAGTGAWTSTGSPTITGDTTDTLDPKGTNIAEKMVDTGIHSAEFATSTAIGSDDGVFGVKLKSQSGTETMAIQLVSSSAGTLAEDLALSVTPVWQKFQINYTNATPGGNWEVTMGSVGAATCYYADAQLEVGSGTLSASSIIDPAATATATRNAETFTHLTSDYIGESKGSVGFWFKPQWVYNKHASVILWSTAKGTGGSGTYHAFIEVAANGNMRGAVVDVTGSAQGEVFSASGLLAQDTWVHIVMTWDVTVSNGVIVYIDGAEAGTSTNDPFVPNPLGTTFSLSHATNSAFGVFDELFTDRTLNAGQVLSAAQVAHIYAAGSLRGASLI